MKNSLQLKTKFDLKKCAENHADHHKIDELINSEENIVIIDGTKYSNWHPLALSHGFPSLCLLFGELSSLFPKESWEEYGHNYLQQIVLSIKTYGIKNPSMFSGISGILLGIDGLDPDHLKYPKLKGNLKKVLLGSVEEKLNLLADKEVEMTDYDIIEGLSGTSLYLLTQDDDESLHWLTRILNYLVSLTDERFGYPNFHISSRNQFTEEEAKLYPDGNFNLGMAHGIAGILLVLSKSMLKGITVPGQAIAIEYIVDFLIKNSIVKNQKIIWPAMLTLENYLTNTKTDVVENRDAWCYGTPGVAVALLYAGKALEREDIIDFSSQSIRSIYSKEEGLFSATICHGYSGLLNTLLTFKKELGTSDFDEYIKVVKEEILRFYDEKNHFGFTSIEFGKSVTDIGLLGGSSGVLLTLLRERYGNRSSWIEALGY